MYSLSISGISELWFTCLEYYHAYFIYLFGVLRHFQHCTGHITTGSWMGRGNQYIQFVRVLYCKLPTNGKQLPAFPLEAMLGIEPRPQRWEVRVLPLCHRGPYITMHTEVVIHSMNAYVWCWSKICGSLDEIPSVTMGSCKSKILNEF